MAKKTKLNKKKSNNKKNKTSTKKVKKFSVPPKNSRTFSNGSYFNIEKKIALENNLKKIYSPLPKSEFDALIKKPVYKKEIVVNSLNKTFKAYLRPEYFKELSLVSLGVVVFGFLKFLIELIYYKIRLLVSKSLTFTSRKKNIIKSEDLGIEDIFAAPPSIKFFGRYLPKKWFKMALNFLIISLLLILPLQALTFYQQIQNTKDRVLALTSEAFKYFQAGQKSAITFNLTTANSQFIEAKQNFIGAQKEINNLNFIITEILKIIPGDGKIISAGLNLIKAGQSLSASAEYVTAGIENLTNTSVSPNQAYNFYNNLLVLEENLNLSIIEFLKAKELINQVDIKYIPSENKETFTLVKKYLPSLEAGLKDLYYLNEAILKILGKNQWQRYLVIFQNNNELRASGGFMGSYALLDIDRGKIKNLEIPSGGTYDLQGSLLVKVASPKPLHLINPAWQFQDANWWLDFPTTASKIQWFFQKSGQPSVDGVIAINATMLEKLLTVVGPIEMPDYGRLINSENFIEETQKIVELEYDREENQPKKFIAELAPKLLNKIFNISSEQFGDLLEILYQGLKEKEILLYFNDKDLQDLILKLDWGGQLKKTSGDYLAVVNTNLAGGKTDRVIEEIINHQAEVLVDGSIIDTVNITKIHQGKEGDLFFGVQNNNYLRIYVPLGSTLISAEGFSEISQDLFETPPPDYQFDIALKTIESQHLIDENSQTEIYNENEKTVFSNWLQIKPGEKKTVTLKYRLPFKLVETENRDGQNVFYYSLLIQKQPGTKGSNLFSVLKLNNELIPLAKYPPEDLTSNQEEVNFVQKLFTNQYYGVILVKKNI